MSILLNRCLDITSAVVMAFRGIGLFTLQEALNSVARIDLLFLPVIEKEFLSSNIVHI